MNPVHALDLPLIGFDHAAVADSWQTSSVNSDVVTRRLNQLWQRLEAPRPRRLGEVRPGTASTDAGAPGTFARTNTFNLLVCARTATRAVRSAQIVGATGTHFPTRAVALYSDPMLDRRAQDEMPEGGPLAVRVALPRAGSPSGRQEHFESVSVIGGPRAIGSAATTAFPLCVPDLPIVLWWNGDVQYDLGVFRDLAGGSDQVIVDSALFGDVERSLYELVPIAIGSGRDGARFTDLSWTRTAVWRGLIAQFFDAPPHPDSVHSITSVTLTYDPSGQPDASPSGQSAALLLTGWLASRLDWRATAPPVRSSLGLRFTFAAPRHAEPVIVDLRPQDGVGVPTGVRRVEIESGLTDSDRYEVEQIDRYQLMTRSRVADVPALSRHVMMPPVSDEALLDGAFRDGGQDVIAESALRTIAGVLGRQQAGREQAIEQRRRR